MEGEDGQCTCVWGLGVLLSVGGEEGSVCGRGGGFSVWEGRRVQCGREEGSVWEGRRVQCGSEEGSVWEGRRVQCALCVGGEEGSVWGGEEGSVWGGRRVQCGRGGGFSGGREDGSVGEGRMVQCGGEEGSVCLCVGQGGGFGLLCAREGRGVRCAFIGQG